MLERKFSKEDLATKAGCSVSTIYNLLAGKRIREKYAFEIAKELGIDFRKILPPKRRPA
jgi:transcriptional regulator with XRE-family HTH domain